MSIFRKSTEQDIEKIAKLEKTTFADAWSAEGLLQTFLQPQAFITVAEEAENIVGYCIVYHVLDEAEIARIAVNPDFRRQGIGRQLLDYTCECCAEIGVEMLLLDVREGNEGARAFYRQYGFEEDGVRKNFYDSPKEHAVLMSKSISNLFH